MDQEERDRRFARVANTRVHDPGVPDAPCPRCGGAWIKDGVRPGDASHRSYFWHCFYCGEVHYG
jgi:hypothetical protein